MIFNGIDCVEGTGNEGAGTGEEGAGTGAEGTGNEGTGDEGEEEEIVGSSLTAMESGAGFLKGGGKCMHCCAGGAALDSIANPSL